MSNDESKRVELPAPVDSAAVNKDAAAASPSSKPLASPLPPKDSIKPDAGSAIETAKKEPPLPLPVAQKSLSNGEKRLLNEQKEIIQKMRGAKNPNAKLPAASTAEKKIDGKKEPSLEKRAPQSVVGEVKKIDTAPVDKNEVPLEQKKMPLPLLVHSNAKGEDNSHAVEPPKREILQNVAPDREKRDLYYVSEGYEQKQPMTAASNANASLKAATELKPASVDHISVAKQTDPAADENLTCEKDSKSKTANTDAKVVSQELAPDSKSKSADESVVEKMQEEPERFKARERVDLMKDDVSQQILVSRSNEHQGSATAADDNKSDGLVIAPSKLSDPVVRLPENVPVDDKLKPALLDTMKPMSRELKTVEDKAEANNKKK